MIFIAFFGTDCIFFLFFDTHLNVDERTGTVFVNLFMIFVTEMFQNDFVGHHADK